MFAKLIQHNFTILQNRSIISISGIDAKTFLQGLITNDINKVNQKEAIYTLMLSPQGRFLYDFFIIQNGEKLLLDCKRERIDEIIQKLSFYKLRSKIEIKKEEEFVVVINNNISLSTSNQPSQVDGLQHNDEAIVFTDPRNNELGFRAIINKILVDNISIATNNIEYNLCRLRLRIVDDSDLIFDQSFPLEFGLDNLNAIDYQKGCYVGQETTARMHYKGVIRKKIFLVEVLDCTKIEKSTMIESDGKKMGEILSSVFYDNKLLALSLIKNCDNEGREINFVSLSLTAQGKEIKILAN